MSLSSDLLAQMPRLGLNLLTFSIVDVISDLYIILGYFGLAIILFLQRSDDWFALFISIMIMTFGVRLTSLANVDSSLGSYQFWVSPILMMGEMGIVLLGWLYPDGHFVPRWLKFVLPALVASVFLLYWPASPLYTSKINYVVSVAVPLFWYFSTAGVMSYRYIKLANLKQRQQIRWIFLGMMGPLVWFLLYALPPLFIPALQGATLASTVFQTALRVLGIFLTLIFPVCLTITIARYKLFDIDLLINRTLVYGALTVILASIFGLILIVLNAIFNLVTGGEQTTLGLVLSAGAVGTLFQPTRKALQRFVDRTFYRIKIDYLKTPVIPKSKNSSDTQTQATALFSSYHNLTLIGKGGMAEVYRADHPTEHRTVAIKVLLANLAEDEQFQKRFKREAQTLAGLEHPNIVRIFDYGVENNLYYMVMEYLDGANLSAHLKQRGQFSVQDALPILKDVADALDYAHTFGMIHRDVKPSNIMMDIGGDAPRAVLTDFGIAKLSGAYTNITASAVLGTFDYIAPEQIQAAADVDGRADIYALGVMTYQLLTGSLPFKRPSTGALLLAHMTAPPPDARDLIPNLPRHTSTAIQRAMSKKPAERYPTAREFVMAME
jgi:serine/threonine-protein kinase